MNKKSMLFNTAIMLGLVSALSLTACHNSTPPRNDKPVSYPGNDIDAQEKELKQFLEQEKIPFTRQGSNLIINLPEDITFNTNSAALKTKGQSTIKQIASMLAKYTQTSINIIGYTDSTGTDAINAKLSLERAQNVAKIFTNSGIGTFRVNAVGAGSENPIASNDTAEGRSQNRRVEIVLSPLQLKR